MVDCAISNLSAALESVQVQRGETSGFWKFRERNGDNVYFEVFAWNGDSYVLELACDRLGDEPIRGRFVDFITKRCVSEAWPTGNPTFAGWFKWDSPNLFICWPGDRGGIEHHADWRAQKYWQKTPNQLHQYLEFIRKCLNIQAQGYQPRSQ